MSRRHADDEQFELTGFELDTLHTYLSGQLNCPDYWAGSTGHERQALSRVLSKVSRALDELRLSGDELRLSAARSAAQQVRERAGGRDEGSRE